MSSQSKPLDQKPSAPVPSPDRDSAFFWEGLKGHSLRIQECASCGRRAFPPMPACPYCASRDRRIVEPIARGSIYSWVVVHHAFHPAFKDDVPYVVATVDLDGGGRMAARIDAPEGLDFGDTVEAKYVDHDGWTELRFTRVVAA